MENIMLLFFNNYKYFENYHKHFNIKKHIKDCSPLDLNYTVKDCLNDSIIHNHFFYNAERKSTKEKVIVEEYSKNNGFKEWIIYSLNDEPNTVLLYIKDENVFYRNYKKIK